MTDNVHWMLEFAIKDGKRGELESLIAEMASATEANEPGTLNYEWFLTPDGKTCHLYERYVDSAATMTHLGTFGEKYAERFLAVAEPSRIVVYGNPDATVRGVLDGFGAVYTTQIGGFAR